MSSGPGRVCETEILLQGCVEMVPCGPGNFDPCQYDMSDCMSVPRGESCTIRCNSVYTGMDFNATCPIENTQVNDGLQFEDGNCLIRECPEPNLTNESVFPWEYVDDDAAGPTALIVQCRVGFAGQPRRLAALAKQRQITWAARPSWHVDHPTWISVAMKMCAHRCPQVVLAGSLVSSLSLGRPSTPAVRTTTPMRMKC